MRRKKGKKPDWKRCQGKETAKTASCGHGVFQTFEVWGGPAVAAGGELGTCWGWDGCDGDGGGSSAIKARASGFPVAPGVPAWHLGVHLAGPCPLHPHTTSDMTPPWTPVPAKGQTCRGTHQALECWRGSQSSAKISQRGSFPSKEPGKFSFSSWSCLFWASQEGASRQAERPASHQHRQPPSPGHTGSPGWCATVAAGERCRAMPACARPPPCPAEPGARDGLRRVRKPTCSRWLFSAFVVFGLRRGSGEVRSRVIYAFSFGCVFLSGSLQCCPKKYKFLTYRNEKSSEVPSYRSSTGRCSRQSFAWPGQRGAISQDVARCGEGAPLCPAWKWAASEIPAGARPPGSGWGWARAEVCSWGA